ncbi:MAG TPA: hypothetical protein VGK22_11395 [Candidatus Angelobacter sp.]|jgi:hypothetical protein
MSASAAKPEPALVNAPETQDGPITKLQVKQALWVACCGAIGGILFWVLSELSGTTLFTSWKWYGQIPALAFLGAIAALFGVLLLTASNLNALKTYIFAIVCGVVWQPIITSAINSYSNVGATRQLQQVSTQTDLLTNTANKGSQQEINSVVKATVPAVTQALDQSDNVQDAGKKQELINSSNKALVALEAAASKAPDSSIQAIQDVGMAASNSNHPDVGINAIHSLREIGIAGAHSNHPEIAKATVASLQALAANGKDPALRSAATSSLKEIQAETK